MLAPILTQIIGMNVYNKDLNEKMLVTISCFNSALGSSAIVYHFYPYDYMLSTAMRVPLNVTLLVNLTVQFHPMSRELNDPMGWI